MTTNEPAWLNWLSSHPLYPALGFAAYFIALWTMVCFVIGQISGWATLSGRFRDKTGSRLYQWHFESARMRTIWGSYSNVVKFGADEAGLYMAVFLPFRVGHAPLFIPWAEIQVSSDTRGILFKSRKLLLGRQELIPLRIGLSLAENIRSGAGPSWPIETTGL